ncbi:hypothetical protein C9J21_16765 [Photobacterium phosphoreum]|uniref:glycosyltransferase n=1 Tax=Photobacterium phosphoreum TaxID=659 RepID=UPI000D175C61|nr:glycosyltransferase [Photobacterium phosphoreum]PSW31394.1 hypothetical protein C9J21_16765 [Photobacterium phosphoreum]
MQNKKNIALLIGNLKDRAGSERIVADTANEFSEYNNVYIFVCGDKNTSYPINDNVKIISITREIPIGKVKQIVWYLSFILALNKSCKRYKIDCIVSHWTKLSICLPFVGRDVKKWAHEHQNDILLPLWLKKIKHMTYSKLDKISVLNITEQRNLKHTCNIYGVIIPGYVSNEFFTKENKNKNKNNKINKLLFVGRLVEEKQPLLLLELLKKSEFLLTDWELDIIGSGPFYNEIENNIKNHFGSKVKLLTPRDLLNDYQESKYILITSKTEGFGLTIIEAMSQGCVPISFNCESGPKNIISNNIDGFLLNTNEEFICMLNAIFNQTKKEYLFFSENALHKSTEYNYSDVMNIWNKQLGQLIK